MRRSGSSKSSNAIPDRSTRSFREAPLETANSSRPLAIPAATLGPPAAPRGLLRAVKLLVAAVMGMGSDGRYHPILTAMSAKENKRAGHPDQGRRSRKGNAHARAHSSPAHRQHLSRSQ